jgi:transposase-like protein
MKKRIRRCDLARRQQWQTAIQQWQSSGQSVRAFCRQEGLKESAFFFWRRELLALPDREDTALPPSSPRASKRRTLLPAEPTAPAARFLPVQVVAGHDPQRAGDIEIVLGSGRAVRVPPKFDRQTLTDVLAVLEGRSC